MNKGLTYRYFSRYSAATFAWLLLAVVVSVLPIIIFRDFTPSNELRYLSIADECLDSGHWWAFTNHGAPYADKPPLYLWCIMLGKLLFGKHLMWFYALFSIIPAFAIAAVMWRWTDYVLYSSFRPAAILMLFSCGLFGGMVFTLRMDMMMTMFIVFALYQFRRLELSETPPAMGQRLLFALWIFLAVFSKGPMGILIPLVATTAWLAITKKMRLWSRAWGWPTWILLLLLCAGWFGAVYAEGGAEYLDNLLVHQTVGRAVNSFHHKRPFWYYLVSLTYTLLPWTFLIIGAIVWRIRHFRKDNSTPADFFLVVILSTLVLLSVISSKLQVYMLPAYPFMVYLGAFACSRHAKSGLVAAGVAIPMGILALAGVVAAAAWWFLPAEFRWPWILVGAFVLIAGGSLTFYWLYASRCLPLAISSLAATVLALVFTGGFAMRDLNPDMGYKAVSDTALLLKEAHPDAEIITWRIDRPENIDVYLGDTPFISVEYSDSCTSMPHLSAPAIIITKKKHIEDLPEIGESVAVGSKFVVVYNE